MKGYTKVPYDHAGFPKIDAIGKFRANVVKELDKQQTTLDREVKKMPTYVGPKSSKNLKNRLSTTRRSENSNIRIDAYFDRSAYDKMLKHINKEIEKKMSKAMDDALLNATFNTQSEIESMRREFKGAYSKNTAVDGDLYDKIAFSLYFGLKKSKGKNQFTSFVAGSYGRSQSFEEEPEGVEGSRGANLILLTADGMGAFNIDSHPLGGTKRLVNHLKNARGS